MSDQRRPGIRPRPTLWRQLDAASRGAFPAACTALLLIVLAAPLGLPGQAELQLAVALACVFFWSLFRPASMSPPVVFALGLLSDLLGAAPPGVTILILLTTHGIAVRARPVLVRQGFLLVWLAFACVAVGAASVGWALNSLLAFRPMPVGTALFQLALTAALYPLLAIPFIKAHRGLADPAQA